VHSFFFSELAELHRDWGATPMPPYGSVFSAPELDDVVAFWCRSDEKNNEMKFASLKVAPVSDWRRAFRDRR